MKRHQNPVLPAVFRRSQRGLRSRNLDTLVKQKLEDDAIDSEKCADEEDRRVVERVSAQRCRQYRIKQQQRNRRQKIV
jgi:hypothetical protein